MDTWFSSLSPSSSLPGHNFPTWSDLKQGTSNQSQGSETFLQIQDSGNNQGLVRFDLAEITSVIGNGTLILASLEVYIEQNASNWGSSGRTVGVHRLTTDWTEQGATWNCGRDTNLGNSQPDCAVQWNRGSFEPKDSLCFTY